MRYISLIIFFLIHNFNSTIGQSISDNNIYNQQCLSDYELAKEIVKENTDKADSIANQMLLQSEDSQENCKGLAYYILGESNYYKSNYSLANEYYTNALEYFVQTNDTLKTKEAEAGIALTFYYSGNYSEALSIFEKLYQFWSEKKDTLQMAHCLNNIGLVFGDWDKYDMEAAYFHDALKLYEAIDNKSGQADMYMNIGVNYVSRNKNEDGIKYYLNALEMYEALNDSSSIAGIYTNLGAVYTEIGELNKAKSYLESSEKIHKLLNDKHGLLVLYSIYGTYYSKANQKEMAIKMFEKCEKLNDSIGFLSYQRLNILDLSKAYQDLGDYKNALRTYQKYSAINDSLFNIEKYEKMAEYEKIFSVQKAENTVLEYKTRIRNHIILSLIILVVLIIIIGLLFYRNMTRSLRAKQQLLSLEQRMLRTQMNPHFIFNSFSAIQSYIISNKTMDAVEFTNDFANLIRLVLNYSMQEYITLKEEKELLVYYLRLQSMRYDNKVKYKILLDKNLEEEEVLVPPMLSQPFVENSFEHAGLHLKDNGLITIQFSKKNNNLSFLIEDNGIGINTKKHQSTSKKNINHKSLAMKITEERLNYINSVHKNNKISLIVEDKSKYNETGTKVEFTIPLKLS